MLNLALIYRSFALNPSQSRQASLVQYFASAKAKLLLFTVVGIGSYLLLTLAVVFLYQDSTEQMNWADREVFNAKIIADYKPHTGLNQTDILQRLGSPDITEAIKVKADIYQVLYFRTHRNNPDGITTADECTALLLKNRQLVAIGPEAIQQFTSIKQYGR
jgi:hypothetical protein